MFDRVTRQVMLPAVEKSRRAPGVVAERGNEVEAATRSVRRRRLSRSGSQFNEKPLGGAMSDTTTMHELLVSTFATADALAKLLIEKGLITQQEFMAKLSDERATYQKLLNPTPQ
jgi:hypothetical protein